MSVLDGIQPAKLATVLAGDDDRLAASVLWAWPREVPYRRPRTLGDPHLWPTILRRLVGLQHAHAENGDECAVYIPLDAEASDLFEVWRAGNSSCAHDGGALFKSLVGKLPGLLLRLALTLELIEWAEHGGTEPGTITAASVVRARDFADHYCKTMALRVYGDAALPAVNRNAATLARWLLRTKPQTVNLRGIRREAKLPGLSVAADVDAAAALLVETGRLFDKRTRAGDTPGQLAKNHTVNPLTYSMDHGVTE